MKSYPFRIVGVNPDTGRLGYLGGARTREAGEKRARSYMNSKHVIAKWSPIRVLTDAEYQAERDGGPQ